MIVALGLGAIVGIGAFVSYRLFFPAPPPLEAALNRLHRRNDLVSIVNTQQTSQLNDVFGRALGAPLGRLLDALGLRTERVEADLRVVGRTMEQHLGNKAMLAITGFALPTLVGLGLNFMGAGISITMPIAVSILLALGFFFLADLILRDEAEERRTDFRHALGSFLDLVVVSLAGGAGVESALRDAAGIGKGWAFVQLRNALDVTALTGETPWAALARLGDELGVTDLSELAASVSLAGTEGARVRESLAAKAVSLRDHALAVAETKAQSTTETMALPVVLLFAGFLLLIGYPAADAILSGS